MERPFWSSIRGKLRSTVPPVEPAAPDAVEVVTPVVAPEAVSALTNPALVNLGRRNHELLNHQLDHIAAMMDTETNPQVLDGLFRLDHLAARMRHDVESMLVLAGEDVASRFRRPVGVHELLQVVGRGIDDFERIELDGVDHAMVVGAAASDVSHMLAELLANAATNSAPEARIRVHGRRRDTGYKLSIVGHGGGMDEVELAAANDRLADRNDANVAPSEHLGHSVVGLLARRHGIKVRLANAPDGIAAQIRLPTHALVVEPQSSAPSSSQWAPPDPEPEQPVPAEPVPAETVPAEPKAAVVPVPHGTAPRTPAPNRRSPEEVRASLERFRAGVERGRNQAR